LSDRRKPIGERDGAKAVRLSSVDVAASIDVHDLDGADILKDAVDHPVVTSASRVQAAELAAQRLAHSLWIVSEGSEDELDASRGHLLR